MWVLDEMAAIEPIQDGSRAGFRIKKAYMHSTITQSLWLYSESRRIDFETEIDWHEHHQLVKAYFPINILANKARYDIQFGNVERPTHQNTSWDEAKFEVCAHKWADISDGGYGVSLLNDCKYGHSCIESELSLTFLKSGTYPNKDADQGKHIFKYAILPHIGDFKTSTVKEAYKFNQNLDAVKIDQNEGMLPENYSYISCDSENVVIETIKQSEKSDGTIVRLFDAHNTTKDITLDFAQKLNKAFICDMLENVIEELPIVDNRIKIRVKNYEIVTLKIV
jgi:alpha-mannosidase